MNPGNTQRSDSLFDFLGRNGTVFVSAIGLLAAAPLAGVAQQNQTWFNLSGFINSGDHWGESVAFLPDLNSDGYPEFLVGGPHYGTDGAVRVVSGKSPNTVLKWHFPDIDFDPNRQFGQVVAYAGDVNNDQIPDYAICVPGENVPGAFAGTLIDGGLVTVYSGKTFTKLLDFKGWTDDSRFGESFAANADVTGDGRPDFLIGAPHSSGSGHANSGQIQLRDGVTGYLYTSLEGNQAGDLLGFSVALLGDLNGDNRSEYAFSVPRYDSAGSATNVGRVYVYNGATKSLLYGKTGSYTGGEFGTAICAVGDTDGDGKRELLVGAPGDQGKGAAYLYEGSSGTLIRTFNGSLSGERFGTWLCKAGDLDKDGFQEIAIGGTEAGVTSGGGFIRVFDGGDGSLYQTQDFFTGSGAGQHASFDGGYDLNLDGWPDLLVGLPDSDQLIANGGEVIGIGQLKIQSNVGFAGPHNLQFSVQGGQLKSGSKANLLLTGGPNGGLPFLVMSTSVSLTPIFGGTLLPNLTNSVVLNFPPMPLGVLSLPNIPGGNGPINFYAQFAVFGFAGLEPIGLSNALILQYLP